MRPPSYMRSNVDGNVVMRHISVFDKVTNVLRRSVFTDIFKPPLFR